MPVKEYQRTLNLFNQKDDSSVTYESLRSTVTDDTNVFLATAHDVKIVI